MTNLLTSLLKTGYDQIKNTKCIITNSIVARLSVNQSFMTNRQGAATDKINQQRMLIAYQKSNNDRPIKNSIVTSR